MMTAQSVPKNREIEYSEICETYRQGVRTLFDTFRFYILFQGGLGTLAGAIFSRQEFQTKVIFMSRLAINFPLLVISLIGIAAAIGAPIIAQRLYRYHDALVSRAEVLERELDMKQITNLGAVWNEGNSYRGATKIAFALFALIAVLWGVAILNSVDGLGAIAAKQ
jgi:hypothetical protein